MNRRKGTSRHPAGEGKSTLITYRELAPSPELRSAVRAYFTFSPGAAPWRGRHRVIREVLITGDDIFCAPLFADAHVSIVVDLPAACHLGSGWRPGGPVAARVIGAFRAVGGPPGTVRPQMVGAYLQPGGAASVMHIPAVALTDRVVDLNLLWGSRGSELAESLAEMDEPRRVHQLESVLLEHLRRGPSARTRLDIPGLARSMSSNPARTSIADLACATGVSRRHFARAFRESVGVSPKRYLRLARFQAGLTYVRHGRGVRWTDVAAILGYADQSHMIAEFREFSSLTPEMLVAQPWFHPFIHRTRSRAPAAADG